MCDSKGVDRVASGSAGAPEITEAMIEAGMREYAGRWIGLRDADDEVAREMLRDAFMAMYLAQQK
jgi:hypothetical protein